MSLTNRLTLRKRKPILMENDVFLEGLIIAYLTKKISYETFEKQFKGYIDMKNM